MDPDVARSKTTTTKSKGGRPSTYSAAIANRICERIAEGEPLTKICRDKSMPAYRTVLNWRVKDSEFLQMYTRAREDAGDTLADEIRELAKRVVDGTLEPNAGRVAIDALKWIASKLKPKVYGDRSRVDVKNEVKYAPVSADAPAWLAEAISKSPNVVELDADQVRDVTDEETKETAENG